MGVFPIKNLLPEIDEELLHSHNIYTAVADLGHRIWGLVYECSHGHYHIVASNWLGEYERRYLFWHEMCHIINDFPKCSYIIGLDTQYEAREKQADNLIRAFQQKH